ncbi:hypothetical protein ACQR1Y_11660 [Bradyrhizobium sp. HKCCYLRH3099]|uniref:hypothetical protein n=1 Tax=unclassified Bradyrhizobium TaxID=2631580 RepID=UPI003EC13EF5
MSEQATIVNAGRAAIERINAGTKRLFEDYLAVGDAQLGQERLAAARDDRDRGTDRP